MDPIIITPRLRLILVTKADRGSPELEWFHELRSDEKATWWSIHGQSKSIDDTEKAMKGYLPTEQGEEKGYRVVYAVHKTSEPVNDSGKGEPHAAEPGKKPTAFLGMVTLKSSDAGSLALPEHLTLPAAAATTTLTIEVTYGFLPIAWGKGYATESIEAVFESCKKRQAFWTPFSKLYVYAIVNEENPASLRVMNKTGMAEKGVYEWTGKPVFLAGRWQDRSSLHIFGKHLLE